MTSTISGEGADIKGTPGMKTVKTGELHSNSGTEFAYKIEIEKNEKLPKIFHSGTASTSSTEEKLVKKEKTTGTAMQLFAQKPRKANHNRPVQLVTNFHRMNIQNKDGNIMKYSVKFEPEVADNAGKTMGTILKGCREQL